MPEVNISGLDKVSLLRALWRRQIQQGFNHHANLEFNEAMAIIAVRGYIAYFCGKGIKTDLSKDTADPYLYDRDAGEYAFECVVEGEREISKQT